MSHLTIFRESFVNKLRGEIPANLLQYRQDEPWLLKASGRAQRELATALETRTPLSLMVPADGDLKDLENAIRMHKALPHLSLLQARDPRLWTRLAHVDLWPYMRKRWPSERHAAVPDRAMRYVDAHYFVSRSESRALLRNGAARLWWIASISHDAERDNPYELTQVLLATLDITQQLLERGMGRARNVLIGFLEFLLKHKQQLLLGGDRNRDTIRSLAKHVNMCGGVSVLDCLGQAHIMNLLESEYARIVEGANSKP